MSPRVKPLAPVDSFDLAFRPKAARDSDDAARSAWGPHAFAGDRRPARAEWIAPTLSHIDQLYARRAELLGRMAAGDASAQSEYDVLLRDLRALQRDEASRMKAGYARDDARLDAVDRLIEGNEQFLQRHAHHLPET